jgi:hypothetical protein
LPFRFGSLIARFPPVGSTLDWSACSMAYSILATAVSIVKISTQNAIPAHTRVGPGSVLAQPAPEPLGPVFGVRLDRFISEPVLEIVGKGARGFISILRLPCHRLQLQADGLQSQRAKEQVSRCVDRTRHDGHLPIGTYRAPHVSTQGERAECCNCNDMPAGLLGRGAFRGVFLPYSTEMRDRRLRTEQAINRPLEVRPNPEGKPGSVIVILLQSHPFQSTSELRNVPLTRRYEWLRDTSNRLPRRLRPPEVSGSETRR